LHHLMGNPDAACRRVPASYDVPFKLKYRQLPQ
jgi:hypothetical protein